jgi:hypothetical protein
MKFFSNKGKLNVYIAFLLLAITTSVVGKLSSEYDRDINFNLTPIDFPADKIIYNQSHYSVVLKLRANGFSLAKYYFGIPEMKISVKKLKEIKNYFLWNQKENFSDTKLNFGSSVELLSISEDSILFFFDQYVSKKIPVKENVNIDFESGYENFKIPVLIPDSVVVTGPKELLSDLKYLETDSVNFENINSDINLNINLINPDEDNIILSDNSLEYLLEVDQYTEEIIKVPVNILFKSDNSKFNYYPKELSIKYNISINDYIEVNPMDFKIECIYDSDSPNNISKAEISKKPSFVKNVRINTDQIQIIILE